MAGIVGEQSLSVTEAASQLHVNKSTIWRWIDSGRLPAYRVGQRRVLLRKVDVENLVVPARGNVTKGETMNSAQRTIRPFTAEEQERAHLAVEQARKLQAAQSRERGGKPFSPSWELLGQDVDRAGHSDAEAICNLDAMVLGRSERRDYLEAAVRAGHCWVARGAGQVVGFVVFAPTFFSQWFIELLIVHPGFRRQGVATALIVHCEAACQANKLFTSTNASNTSMQRLLRKLKYRRSGRIDNLDEGNPEIIYVKRLQTDRQ